MLKKGDTLIFKNVEYLDSFFSQTRGLMFRKKLKDHALLFKLKKPAKISIHMLFVFYPIDFLFLDAKKTIVDLGHLQPFFGFRNARANVSYLIELPLETIERYSLKVGDELFFD